MREQTRIRRGWAYPMGLCLLAVLAACIVLFTPRRALANIDEGTCGTCSWVISDDGTLTIGAGTLDSPDDDDWGIWPWSDHAADITRVVSENGVVAQESIGNIFGSCQSLTSVDVSGWDTSAVIDMAYAFYDCSSLASVDLSGWNTANVKYLSGMFFDCTALTSVNMNGWLTSSVHSTNDMFSGCGALTTLDLSKWETSSLENVTDMFWDCKALTSMGIENWDTSCVTNMAYLFCNCEALTALDLSEWDTSSVQNMEGVFYGCSSLTSLDVADWDTSSVLFMDGMFALCKSLPTLDIARWDISSVYYINEMFFGCEALTSLDLASWNTKTLTNMAEAFYACSSLTALDINSWDISKVDDLSWVFGECSSLTSLDLSKWNTSSVKDMGWLFYNCSSLTTLDLTGWNTAAVEPSYDYYTEGTYDEGCYMYAGCDALTEWRVGKGYQIKSNHMVPEATAANDLWWSIADKTWYSKAIIAASRSGKPDTYTSEGSSDTPWLRLAGNNRYATMRAIVSEGFSQSDYAVLATGQNFPDALVASSVAGALNCPVVLTEPSRLTAEAAKELKELGVSHVYVMGSEKTISNNVLNSVTDLGISSENIVRIAGTDRQATSLDAMRMLDSDFNAYDGTVVIASGFSFPDALAIGPWCYANSVPILLAGNDGSLSKAQLEALGGTGMSTKATNVIVLGGTDRVSSDVRWMIELTGATITSLAGNDRYETAAMIAAWEIEQGMTAANVTVATGQKFPDALAGAPLCGKNNSVLLLADDGKNTTDAVGIVTDNKDQVTCGYVLGDENSVSKSLFDALKFITK